MSAGPRGRGCSSPASTARSCSWGRSTRCRSWSARFPSTSCECSSASFRSSSSGSAPALARPRHGRRRVQPQGGAGARGRGEPAPSGPCRGALRRDAAGLAPRGDRALPLRRRGRVRRDGRARTRREPPVRDAPVCGDDEVRRSGAPQPVRMGARPDRGTRRTVRARRAWPRRRPLRDRLGRAGPDARRVGARAARPPAGRVSGLPRRRRGAHPSASRRPRRRRPRATSTPRSSPGTRSRYASGRPRAGSRSSRSSLSACASTPCSGGCASVVAAYRSRIRGRS